jgi:hypothetical protein
MLLKTRILSSPPAELLVVVRRHDAVSNILVVIHSGHGFLASILADGDRLYPALQRLSTGQVQHRQHLGAVSNVRCAERTSVGGEVLRHQRSVSLVSIV